VNRSKIVGTRLAYRATTLILFSLGMAGVRAWVRPARVAGAAAAHWGYAGAEGPRHWAELDPSFSDCARGRAQSPIDLTGARPKDLPNIRFDYRPSRFEVVNNGHTIQVNGGTGNSIRVDGVTYRLLQFHFHSPSEHTINGKRFPLELHLVHQDNHGHLAVVGVLFQQSGSNPALAPVWKRLPARSGEQQPLGVAFNAFSLLPADQRSYRYIGSLTTPTCAEGVRWMVMESPVRISPGQLAAFRRLFPFNSRPLQPLNGRPLTEDTSR
jgi:carbonic anhydrase